MTSHSTNQLKVKLKLITSFYYITLKLKDKKRENSKNFGYMVLSGKMLILHPVKIFFYEILCTGPEIILLWDVLRKIFLTKWILCYECLCAIFFSEKWPKNNIFELFRTKNP